MKIRLKKKKTSQGRLQHYIFHGWGLEEDTRELGKEFVQLGKHNWA